MTGWARKPIANNVRALRMARGMTQAQLASAAKIDRSYVSLIENEHFSISVDQVEKLALALGVKIHEMFMPNLAKKLGASGKL